MWRAARFPLCTISMGMLHLLLGHIAADGTMLVVLLCGGFRVPGMGFAYILYAADGADMVVLALIRVFRQIGV